MRPANTRGGATGPAAAISPWRAEANAMGPDGVRYELTMGRGGAAWLVLAVVGMIVTFAFGLWLVQSAHSMPGPPPYDPGPRPAASSPPDPAGVQS